MVKTALTFEEKLALLAAYDLTEYQSRVYLSLLQMGESTAGQLPSVSRVPRPRIYDTMAQLHEKGLVHIIPETPTKYRPVPFGDYLLARSREYSEKARSMELGARELEADLSFGTPETPSTAGRFEIIYGRRNVTERITRMYSAAKEEIVSIGTSTSPTRIMKTTFATLKEKASQGVHITYGFPVNGANREKALKVAASVNVVQLERDPPMHFVVIDRKQTMMIHRIPDDEEPLRGEDVALWSDDAALVRTFHDISNRDLKAGRTLKP